MNYFDGGSGAELHTGALERRYLDYLESDEMTDLTFSQWLAVEIAEGYVCTSLIRCPDDSNAGQTVVGCGKMTPDVRDDEGFVDCMNCGMFWLPELEVVEL